MNYQQALEYLNSRINFERAAAIPYQSRCFKLQRMEDLLALVGSPHRSLRAIHIAGTKGKGSTAAMISSILSRAGYRVGRFTSPHLETVRERLVVDGQICPQDQFAQLIRQLISAIEEVDKKAEARGYLHGPTYFEIVTAAAFLYFAQEDVDFAVLEVGLGGRLDATNVCLPLVTVVTSISFDHMDQLGYSLASIAREKAGIIKRGVPSISGVREPEAREVIEAVCAQVGSPLRQLGVDFDYSFYPPQTAFADQVDTSLLCTIFDYVENVPRTSGEDPPGGSASAVALSKLAVSLLGEHQAANGAVAVATVRELVRQGWEVSEATIREGLRETSWPGRVEVLCTKPVVILDGAHNQASMAALLQTLRTYFGKRRLLVLFGTSRDKDVAGMLKCLLAEADLLVLTQVADNPRAMPAEELAQLAQQLGAKADSLRVVAQAFPAWQALKHLASPRDVLCVTGSLFLVGELRRPIIADLTGAGLASPPE
ncbi:MAG: bifunctional folylpolyglutamate synthase/dihydrofolate synthase [Thermoguttaceae bacterium]|nr:bifunctional folylpolyglutamate synthase/dihydrofolate synthase [Thermoguttaceae bacterium]MDW8078017.1 folylpolyglutamate synthase/dihydrofolate synthase family protein [Thermoguttaceae bacterium]